MTEDLMYLEAEKYRKVWEHDSYRKVSPGELEMASAWNIMGCAPGESLNDYGSGTARATKWFQDEGLNVLGIDIASNAAETPVLVQEACLWDMDTANVPPADYGFCCDVMEHIPPEKVRDVLRGIRDRTRNIAYFRIATRPDVMGPRLLGEPLHLTVWPSETWESVMVEVWPGGMTLHDDGKDLVMVAYKEL